MLKNRIKRFMMPDPARVEQIQLTVALDAEAVTRHRELINIVSPLVRSLLRLDDDIALVLKYNLSLEYFYETADRLRAMRDICRDRELVIDVNLDELEYGESVLISLLDEIRAIQSELRAKAEAAGSSETTP